MLRNKEYKLFISAISIVLLLNMVGCFWLASSAGILAIFVAVGIGTLLYVYNKKRYEKLQTLSCYLRRICSGEYTLDIRDNEEGELSILQNEIYKVTLRLLEQHWKIYLFSW